MINWYLVIVHALLHWIHFLRKLITNIQCSRFPDLQIIALPEPSQMSRSGVRRMCITQ